MSYFSRYRKHPAGECSLCHKPLGELYLTLSRIQLPASRFPSAHCPPWELERTKVIAAYCPAHSLDVSKSKLQALGIASTNLPLTHGTWRCGCCGINPVNYSAPNTLYAVHTLNSMAGEFKTFSANLSMSSPASSAKPHSQTRTRRPPVREPNPTISFQRPQSRRRQQAPAPALPCMSRTGPNGRANSSRRWRAQPASP